jgi:DNA-binding NarL/FixJ family response regulator
MINVIIADQNAIFRVGVANLLAVEDDIHIVGQPQTLAQMLNGLERLRVHVLVMSSIFLSSLSAIQSLAACHSTAILVVAENGDEASSLIAMGVQGVVFRSVSTAVIVDAVRRLTLGKTFVHSPNSSTNEISEDIVGTRVRGRLSEKELRIIAAVVGGHKNREIAMQFNTTEQVVKNSLCIIFDKMGVSDRLELSLFVIHHRMLAHATALAHVEPRLPSSVHTHRQMWRTGSLVSNTVPGGVL